MSVHIRHSSIIVLTDTQLEDIVQNNVSVYFRKWQHGSQIINALVLSAASSYLEVFGNWSIGEADVEFLDIISLPHVHPGVVGHRWKEFRDVGVRGQSHVVDGIKTQVLL